MAYDIAALLVCTEILLNGGGGPRINKTSLFFVTYQPQNSGYMAYDTGAPLLSNHKSYVMFVDFHCAINEYHRLPY